MSNLAVNIARGGAGTLDISQAVQLTTSGTYLYETCDFPVGTDYQVPSGKTLLISRVSFHGPIGQWFRLGFSNSAVNTDTVGTWTGAGGVYLTERFYVSGPQQVLDVAATIPSNKWSQVISSASGIYVHLFGILLDV